MKRLLIALILGMSIPLSVFAQDKTINAARQENNETLVRERYIIDPMPLLRQSYETAVKFNQENPDAERQMRLRKSTAWNFTVGTAKEWNAQNLTTNKFYKVPSTCRAVGKNCYIFVENAKWGTAVTQAGVDSVVAYFDNKTPANPSKGVYQTNVDAFGNPPDVDGDPKIIILLLDIQDGYEGAGGYVAGYFDPVNEITNANSNMAEIYYLDCDPQNLTTSGGIREAISTTAHEFQHMIHYNYHKTKAQETFINEGCSMLAEVHAGFGLRGQTGTYGYNNETNRYLLDWRSNDGNNVLKDYSRAARFFTYLRDQFGMGIFRPLVASQTVGTGAITEAIISQGTNINFTNLFVNFAMANIVDDKSINTSYGYTYPNIPKPTGTVYTSPNATKDGAVQRYGVEYFTFNGGNTLKFKVATAEPELVIKGFLSGPGGKKVVDLTANTEFNVTGFGSTYTSVTFALINPVSYTAMGNFSIPYTVTATGSMPAAMELKWDTTEPTGYYQWATNDTICTAFDAVPGGKLDSIRVALRRAGTIKGGIYTFTGTQNPSTLGKPLAIPISASITTETPVPYPVPFKNWATVDLSEFKIKTDQPFAVAFVIGSNPMAPGVMSTRAKYPSEAVSHNFTYISAADNLGSIGWYIITTNSTRDTAAIYMIRAYVSFGPTDVKSADSRTAPSDFSLAQNYPNPFNPSTTLKYALPVESSVRIDIYNSLGEKVRELVNKVQSAGNHEITFNASELSSGIYFYSLEALAADRSKEFRQMRKMLLLK